MASLTGFALAAQTTAPPGPPQAPGRQGGGASAPAEPGAAAPGRAGGRGRGNADTLAGGPQLSDPAYTNYDFSKKPSVQPLTPAEELTKFILQPGYRMELVLSDPDIQDPTAIAFDGNGRMFVIEDRGYMQDVDGDHELDPVGRVSMHVDTHGNGVYDKHTVFVDNLVFPRFATPFGPNSLLIKESNAQELWKYTDTDGDGVADKKELFDTGYGRLGQHRAPGELPHVGPRQLDVQHDQQLSRALDSARGDQGTDGIERGPVGRDAGQRRQDLVPGRRERPAVGPGSSRSCTAISVAVAAVPDGPGSRDSVGRAGSCRGHAGWPRCRPHA